jgi:hypothetical protein
VQLGQIPNLTPGQAGLYEVLSWGFLVVDAAVGVTLLRR